jgi:predicted nucleic acid-binding Zn ribbon protein
MQSLISCVPQRFIRSIESDDEVVMMFLKELWPHIVGEELARNTEPAVLSGKVLEVRVPSVLWASQLAGLHTMMIGSINRFWGVRLVETIRWEVDL